MLRALLVALLAMLAVPSAGQDPALRDAFQQGKGLWSNQGDRDGAAAKIEMVIGALAPNLAELPQDWRRTLCEAYNWLAVLDDRNPASKARAARNLEAALDVEPDFEIDRALTPSRLQALFDGLRASKLVKVKVTYQPEGGFLLLNGRSTEALAEKYVPVGSHRLVYRKPGYASAELPLVASTGTMPSLDFKLQRTSSTVRIYVSPPGAEVFLDGRSLGKVEGAAGLDGLPYAEKAKVKLEALAGPFLLDELPPGDHVLRLTAPCHRPRNFALEGKYTQPFQDVTFDALVLEPSQGTLAVTSDWDGGELYLDGVRKGSLPMPPFKVCSGTYALEVRFPNGGFTRSIEVEDGRTLPLAVKPKPRLVWLGWEGEETFTGKVRLQSQLLALGERLDTLAFLPRAGTDPPQALQNRMKSAKEAELFLRAEVRREGAVQLVELVLSTLENEEERIPLKTLEADPLAALVLRLNRMPRLAVPWTGISVVDVPGQPGPWVLQADDAARKAGIQVLQPVLTVNDQAVANAAAFHAALSKGRTDRVTVQQPHGTIQVPVGQATVEIPLADPALSYPFLLAELRLRLLGAKGEAAHLLRFQLALALMHYRKFERAVELLREVRLQAGTGVGQGTVEYYTGLCLLRLGAAYYPEAIQAFSQALKHPGATLFGPEGPLVAPLAKQAIEDHKLN